MTVDRLVDRITPACRSRLLDTLHLRLTAGLDLPGEEPYPPGAVDYWAQAQVTWYPEDDSPDDLEVLQTVATQGTEVDDGIRFNVGEAHFVVADLLQSELFDALDAREADLANLGGILFPPGENRMLYEIEEELSGSGSHAVLVNSVEIEPLWRGIKLGLLSTGIAIRELGRGCGFAALDAMQPGVKGPDKRKSTHKRLSWYWHQLGFESWHERVMVLDLGTTTLDDRLAELVNRHPLD